MLCCKGAASGGRRLSSEFNDVMKSEVAHGQVQHEDSPMLEVCFTHETIASR